MKKYTLLYSAVVALALVSCDYNGSVVILGGLTFVNFSLCIHLY